MTPSDLTADLPAPRDDEPASLRQDIADELADHLACAVRREELRSGGSVNAAPGDVRPHPGPLPGGEGGTRDAARAMYGRVLARFGDPRAVARRLWWDHMQERIMAQRLTALMAGTAAVACVAACLVLWQFVQDSRNSQAAALAEMREFNAKLLAGLQRPVEAPAANGEWAKVRVKLVDAETGEPVDDATVRLMVMTLGSEDATQLEKRPVNGVVDFGDLPLGRHFLDITSPSRKMSYVEPLLLGPNHPEELLLRLPRNTGLSVSSVDLAPPEPIDERLRFALTLHFENLEVDGRAWSPAMGSNTLVIDAAGRVLGQIDREEATTEHSGYDVALYRIGDASPVPATSISLDRIEVLEPINAELAGTLRGGGSAAQPSLVGHQLLSLKPSCPVEVEQNADGACVLRLHLAPSFWSDLAHAEVLAGLSAPPAGTQIVELASIQPPSDLRVGRSVRVVITLPSSQSRARNGYESLSVVEAVEFAGLGDDLVARWDNGTASAWNCKVLVTTEQAALLELAERVPQSGLSVNSIQSMLVTPVSIESNANLRERLQQAIDAGEPPANEGTETSNSQT